MTMNLVLLVLGAGLLALLIAAKCSFVLIREQQVGIVISFVGAAHVDVSGVEFKHGDLVNTGHKGVWVTPLYPGKHPINTRVMKVELVPTTNIVLNWASRTEAHRYDEKLSSITVRSKDGFGFNLDVAQIIHVGALDAPKVISRVGSMQNLVDHVLQPIVGNYFRNSAQGYTVMQLMQIVGERNVRIVPDVAVSGQNGGTGLVDGLLGLMLHQKTANPATKQS